MLWHCLIKVPMVFDQCALPRGVTWRDPARHVTCTAQPIGLNGGSFYECVWERCACGMGTQIVCKLLPPHFFEFLSGYELPLSVLWCCIMVTLYLICNLWVLLFSVQSCLMRRDKKHCILIIVPLSLIKFCVSPLTFCVTNNLLVHQPCFMRIELWPSL